LAKNITVSLEVYGLWLKIFPKVHKQRLQSSAEQVILSEDLGFLIRT
jgi:hypothetical protein